MVHQQGARAAVARGTVPRRPRRPPPAARPAARRPPPAIAQPPAAGSQVVFPVVTAFFPKKLKERMYKVEGRDTAKLQTYLPKASLFEPYGGDAGPIDMEAWVKAMS
jgi:hypothetical protein